MSPVSVGLGAAAVLFVVGLGGALLRRNVLFVLVSIEVMLAAAGLALVAAGARHGAPDGQVLFLFVLATAASEAAVGLALLLELHRRCRTLHADAVSTLRD